MRRAHPGEDERGVAVSAADVLRFAAAPAFAGMALVSLVLDGGPMDAICATGHGADFVTGMVPMYALMSVFHLGPWLRRFGR